MQLDTAPSRSNRDVARPKALKYLDPESLSRVGNVKLVAKQVVEGFPEVSNYESTITG